MQETSAGLNWRMFAFFSGYSSWQIRRVARRKWEIFLALRKNHIRILANTRIEPDAFDGCNADLIIDIIGSPATPTDLE